MLENAPINALRSHLYPVEPELVGQALESMQPPMGAPREHWLPLTAGQQQWKKTGRWDWLPSDSTEQQYALFQQAAASMVHGIHYERPPWETGDAVAQAFNDYQFMNSSATQAADPAAMHPIARGVPYPSYLPVEALDTLTELENAAKGRYWGERRVFEHNALRRMQELDDLYGQFTR